MELVFRCCWYHSRQLRRSARLPDHSLRSSGAWEPPLLSSPPKGEGFAAGKKAHAWNTEQLLLTKNVPEWLWTSSFSRLPPAKCAVRHRRCPWHSRFCPAGTCGQIFSTAGMQASGICCSISAIARMSVMTSFPIRYDFYRFFLRFLCFPAIEHHILPAFQKQGQAVCRRHPCFWKAGKIGLAQAVKQKENGGKNHDSRNHKRNDRKRNYHN